MFFQGFIAYTRRTFGWRHDAYKQGLYHVIMMIVKSVIYSPALLTVKFSDHGLLLLELLLQLKISRWLSELKVSTLRAMRCNLPLIFNQETRRLHTLVLNIHMLCSLLIILLLFMVTLHLTLWYSFYVYAFLYALLSAKNAVL